MVLAVSFPSSSRFSLDSIVAGKGRHFSVSRSTIDPTEPRSARRRPSAFRGDSGFWGLALRAHPQHPPSPLQAEGRGETRFTSLDSRSVVDPSSRCQLLTGASVQLTAGGESVDLGALARVLKRDDAARSYYVTMLDDTMSDTGMVRGDGGEASVDWLISNGNRFDLVEAARRLTVRGLLLIGGWKDDDAPVEGHLLPLYRALQRHGARNVSIDVLDDEHDFVAARDALARRIISWIETQAAS